MSIWTQSYKSNFVSSKTTLVFNYLTVLWYKLRKTILLIKLLNPEIQNNFKLRRQNFIYRIDFWRALKEKQSLTSTFEAFNNVWWRHDGQVKAIR